MQTKLDALLIANERLNEDELLGLELKPDSTIKEVQLEVHDTGSEPASPGAGDAGPPPGPTGREVAECRGRIERRGAESRPLDIGHPPPRLTWDHPLLRDLVIL
jgi:hypothetical protein